MRNCCLLEKHKQTQPLPIGKYYLIIRSEGHWTRNNALSELLKADDRFHLIGIPIRPYRARNVTGQEDEEALSQILTTSK